MPVFPHLNSGAVSQYPTTLRSSVAVEILRFLDGSDQRFRLQSGVRRQWQIRLDLLTTSEACALDQFFVAQSGLFSPFDFLDPVSGTLIPNCRFSDASFERDLVALNVEALSLWVMETYG